MTQAFDSLEFLTLAQELAKKKEEVGLRTAVGRSYYAVFLIARKKTGIRKGKGRRGVHMRVIDAIKGRRGYEATGQKLGSLFRLRIVADYQLSPKDPNDRNWVHNWSRASCLASNIIPKLQEW